MKIDAKEYEAKKYYSFNKNGSGYEVVEFEKPREVLIDECDYLALGEDDWKALKSKLGITKSDDEVVFEDVVREYGDLQELASKTELEGLLYQGNDNQFFFVDEVMEDAYIIFWVNRDDRKENDVIRVYKGEELSSCYFGVCHQPFVKEFWNVSNGDGYKKTEYYVLGQLVYKEGMYQTIKVYLIFEPDNKEERLRVLRGSISRSQDGYWEWSVMSVEEYNKWYADGDEEM